MDEEVHNLLPIIETFTETKWEVVEEEPLLLPIREILLETKSEVDEVQKLKENLKKKHFQSFLQDTYKKLKI